MAVRFLDEAPPRKVRARFLDEEPDVAPELPQDIPLEDASIAPAPAMSEEAALSAGFSGSNMPPPTQTPTLSEQDPRFPEVQAGVSGANALLEQTLLPTRLDWRNSLPVQEIRMQASIASAEAELARREVATIDPLNFPGIQAARERRDVLLNRAEPMQAYAEQVRPRTGFEQQEIEAAKAAEQNEQFRRELNERGDAPGILETANSKFWSKASDLAAGVLRQGAPDTAQALSQFGGEAGEMAGINTGARGKIGRGAGEVGFLAATMGRGGLPGLAAGTLAGAVATREQVLRETGSTTEADKAALETYPALALYMLTGMAAAKGAAALVPENASKLTKGLAGFAGAEVGNVAPSVVIRALNGQDYDLEAFTADTLFAAFHGVGEYRGAIKAEAAKRAENELRSRGWSEQQINQPFQAGAETPATMLMRAPEETAPFIANENTPPIAPEAPQQARQTAAPIGEPPAPPPEVVPVAEVAVPAQVNPAIERGNLRSVGAYNEAVDAQRAQRGLEPLMSEARLANQEIWDAAQARIAKNPELPAILTEEIQNGTRKATSKDDQAVLAWRMVDLTNKRDQAAVELNRPDIPEGERLDAESAFKEYEKQLQGTEEANRKFGTEWGRTGQFRQRLFRSDYSMATMEARARIAKGEGLTPDEVSTIQNQSEEIQQKERQLEARREEVETSPALDEAIKEIELQARENPEFTPEVRTIADRIVSGLDSAAESAMKRIRARLGKTFADPFLLQTVAQLGDYAIIGASKIGKGLVKFGRWSADMVKDFGDEIKPHLEKIWKASNDEIDTRLSGVPSRNSEQVREAVKREKATATADQITAGMKGKKLADLRSDVGRLVETLVKNGVRDRNVLVDAVHESLKQDHPETTRRQSIDLISLYGEFKKLNTDEAKVIARDLRGQLQQVAKIEDLIAGVPLKKTGMERRTVSDEERTLIKQVNELAKERGVKVTDPAVQLRTVVGAIETRLTNRIKDLRSEIAKGERVVKEKAATPTSEKIETLRKELSEVEAQHEAVFGKRGQTDAQKLKAYKTRTQKRIAELDSRRLSGDFDTKPRKKLDASKDPEAVRLQSEIQRAKKKFDEQRFKWEQSKRTAVKKLWDGVKEVAASTRSAITSLDISAPFRQGGFLLIGDLVTNPARAARQIGTMFRQLANEKNFEESQAALQLRPNSDFYQQAKLYLSDMDSNLSAREESMRSNLVEKIPLLGRAYRASNRAYTGFLNRQRADSFDAMVEAIGGREAATPEQLQSIANFVNTATGRGTVVGFEKSANALARYFFSPRFLASRFELALGAPLANGTGVRKQIAKQYAKFALGLSAIYGLSMLAGATVEKDPRSADFGKMKVGNTRIDPLAGLAQVTTFLAREITGETKSGREVKDKNRWETLMRFGRTKLAPIPGLIADRMDQKRLDLSVPTPYRKDPLKAAKEDVTRLTVPLSASEIPALYSEHGAVKGTIMQMLNLIGMGVQNYGK